jgi:hypothetical protein
VTDVSINRAIDIGEQSWNRSKIMLVGEGQVGKTSLGRSLMGMLFDKYIPSTCGISAMHMLSIDPGTTTEGQWADYEMGTHEFDRAVAHHHHLSQIKKRSQTREAEARITTVTDDSDFDRPQLCGTSSTEAFFTSVRLGKLTTTEALPSLPSTSWDHQFAAPAASAAYPPVASIPIKGRER